jgi:hypothetical protein
MTTYKEKSASGLAPEGGDPETGLDDDAHEMEEREVDEGCGIEIIVTRRVGHLGGAFKQEKPEGHGHGEPDEQERGSDDGGGRLVTVEEEHRERGVDEEGGGSGEHAAGFDGGVARAIGFNSECESGERYGGRGAEKAGEAFRSEDGAEEGEAGDKESSDKEAEEELDKHGRLP